MSKLKLVQLVKQLVTDDKVPLAIQHLQEALQGHSQENEVVTISSQWTKLNKEIRLNIIAKADEELKRNKIIHNILNLSDTLIEASQPTEKHPESKISPSLPKSLEIPAGVVRLDSSFYLERSQEKVFIKNIEQPGALLRIRGPRQYGKSSLLIRVKAHAIKMSYHHVAIDFKRLEKTTLSDKERLLNEFCFAFAHKFNRIEALEKIWSWGRPRNWTTTTFMENEILSTIDKPILLAIDDADRLFDYQEVSDDFFLLLRSWHEESNGDDEIWEKFRLAITYSTEASLAVKEDMFASPFNVGIESRLNPFTNNQLKDLTKRHRINEITEEYDAIIGLLGGHPYLVRHAMYLIANKDYTSLKLLETAIELDGPFNNHLRKLYDTVKRTNGATEAIKTIIRTGNCHNPVMATKLESIGLISGARTSFQMANQLYAGFFKGIL